MSKKVMRMIVQQVEVKRSLLFYATGVTAYVTAHFMWRLVSSKDDLPTLLFFIKSLTLISTFYWGCILFAVITYRLKNKYGYLIGSLALVASFAAYRLVHQHESDSGLWFTLSSITSLSLMGAFIGLGASHAD